MNTTYSLSPSAHLFHADCREALRALPDNSIDSVVTDPPYHLTSIVKRFGGANAAPAQFGTDGAFARASTGFMGKSWDGGDIAFQPALWAEVLRVLKPGGHVAAFGASRGYHRMACAIEDAGFEIRDSLMWCYGTGFPKSHDVSKGIDKAGGDALAWKAFSREYDAAVSASQYKHSDVDRALGIKASSCYWARTDHRGGMPPRHHWEKVRELLGLSAAFERLYDEAEREVIGQGSKPKPTFHTADIGGAAEANDYNLTAPATDAAREWEGWGTALKPAFEPIVLARKPLSEGTVAANVLRWRTGALNIDACRVPTDETITATRNIALGSSSGGVYSAATTPGVYTQKDGGRWPANLVLSYPDDEYALRSDVTPAQIAELGAWFAANS